MGERYPGTHLRSILLRIPSVSDSRWSSRRKIRRKVDHHDISRVVDGGNFIDSDCISDQFCSADLPSSPLWHRIGMLSLFYYNCRLVLTLRGDLYERRIVN